MSKKNKLQNNSYCAIPFVHMNTTTGGLFRYCCNMNSPAYDKNQRPLTLYENKLEEAWNSDELAKIRLKMLEGTKVKQCTRCYYEEEHGSRSLRIDYNEKFFREQSELLERRAEDAKLNNGKIADPPIFVELKFGNLCNIKCRMCSPIDSSMIQKEYEAIAKNNREFDTLWEHREQVSLNEEMKISEVPEWYKNEERLNSFLDIIPQLEKIHFAGGEPTLHEEFYYFLNAAVKSGHASKIELSFNTNATQIRNELLELLPKFRQVSVHASVDGYGKVQEYIRYPSNWDKITENLQRYAEIKGNVSLTINPTLQIYNLFELPELFRYAAALGKKNSTHIDVTPNILDNPDYLNVRILPLSIRLRAAKQWNEFANEPGHSEWFKDRLTTLVSVISDPNEMPQVDKIRNFYTHTFALDKNRGQNFSALYPQLHDELIEVMVNGVENTETPDGNTVRVIKDGTYFDHRPETLIAKGINKFSGWTCSVGVNGLFIDWSGEVYPGTCLTTPQHSFGNVSGEFHLGSKWEVCDKASCNCNLEITLPKYSPSSNLQTATQISMSPKKMSVDPLFAMDAVLPALRWDRESKYVMWAIGRRCNYSCSYCDDEAHSSTAEFVKATDLYRALDTLQAEFAQGRQMRFAFSGGEPTLHPEFLNFVKKISSLGHFVGVTTNASRTADYYVEMLNYATICFSLHFEFLREDRFLKIIESIITAKTYDVRLSKRWVDIRFMVQPGDYARAKRLLDKLKSLENFDRHIFYSFVPIRKKNTNELMDYTADELSLIEQELGKKVPESTEIQINAVKKELARVSPSFCIAKWSGVTIHFESGTTHSCHHPKVHRIPPELVAQNPSALHNTPYKIKQREKMIKGERPLECEYCWRMEDLPGNVVSDRFLKSGADWSFSQLDEIISDPLNDKYIPRYVEVSFTNNCQFKCSYCSAEHSSSWENELIQFGNYPNNTGRKTNRLIAEDENLYVEAFWNWWPELSNKLHTFRITGGEPLLSTNTFRVLEDLLRNPQPNLSIGINSNLGAPKVLIDKFISLINRLEKNNCVREIIIFPSIDAFGAKAEYIRHGLKHDYFWKNFSEILEKTRFVKMTIMCTFNAMSITSFNLLFDRVVELNRRFRRADFDRPILMDISYLRYPEEQTVKALPPEYIEKMKSISQHIRKNADTCKLGKPFYELELIKIDRILEYMREPVSVEEKYKLQYLFYEFFREHDRRRGVSFLAAFPEMTDFWNLCEAVYSQRYIYNFTKIAFLKLPKFNFYLHPKVTEMLYFFFFEILLKPVYFMEYVLVVRFKIMKSNRLKSTNVSDYK